MGRCATPGISQLKQSPPLAGTRSQCLHAATAAPTCAAISTAAPVLTPCHYMPLLFPLLLPYALKDVPLLPLPSQPPSPSPCTLLSPGKHISPHTPLRHILPVTLALSRSSFVHQYHQHHAMVLTPGLVTPLDLCHLYLYLYLFLYPGKDISLLYAQLRLFFSEVSCSKPRSSRNSSIEAFVVCRGFRAPPGFDPSQLRALLAGAPGPLQQQVGGSSVLTQHALTWESCVHAVAQLSKGSTRQHQPPTTAWLSRSYPAAWAPAGW
jgi:hypothetical protein